MHHEGLGLKGAVYTCDVTFHESQKIPPAMTAGDLNNIKFFYEKIKWLVRAQKMPCRSMQDQGARDPRYFHLCQTSYTSLNTFMNRRCHNPSWNNTFKSIPIKISETTVWRLSLFKYQFLWPNDVRDGECMWLSNAKQCRVCVYLSVYLRLLGAHRERERALVFGLCETGLSVTQVVWSTRQ